MSAVPLSSLCVQDMVVFKARDIILGPAPYSLHSLGRGVPNRQGIERRDAESAFLYTASLNA